MSNASMEIFSLWTIYDHPSDYPDCFIARRFELDRTTDDIITSNSLSIIRDQLQLQGLYCMTRHPSDDANIIETWF